MPDTRPVISIGMPVYNGGAHLAEALESLLAQTFRNFEIILSDNCSTDATPGIIADYAARDGRIHAVRQRENIGGLPNFRFVLEAANGEYFMWAAYDDWHDPNYLAALHGALADNPALQMAAPRIVRIRVDGSVAGVSEVPPMPGAARIRRVMAMLSASAGGMFYGLYRREAIRSAFDRAERDFPYVWAADHLTMLPFFVNDRAIGVPQTSFYNRETGLSEGRYRPRTARESWAFLAAFLRFYVHDVLQSRLTLWEKVICLAYLPVYCHSKAVKWRRLLPRGLARGGGVAGKGTG
ncbi:MAG: glycosyltransferase family 2 protein [Alphaproteobacteria bacterium]|nr:glycosyltransferase family 2 protein [Alphaproteobacteria bacterium]